MTKPKQAAMNFAEWDRLDPIANALLDLIERQNTVACAINAAGEARDDETFATEAEVQAAFDACTVVIVELPAQTACLRYVRSRRGKSRHV